MKAHIEFTAYNASWTLTPDDRIEIKGEKGPGHTMKQTLQILVDDQAGLHVPSEMILDRALAGIVDYELGPVRQFPGGDSDLVE